MPTPEQIQTVIDGLTEANKIAKLFKGYNVEMAALVVSLNNKNCHAGWYGIGNRLQDDYFCPGATLMAEHLGMEKAKDICNWAENNPDIWGNNFGGALFSDCKAFGENGSFMYLESIINHWKGVKERLQYALVETV